ncbi:glyoxalase/bleomycin resistance/dioxygenase family protein, partial [bacterium]|nr:glyoxalase/bleomycin resistance/dioxygenase family protein [bacterium]
TEDHGIFNVGFEGGLSLYQRELFQNLTGGLSVQPKSNSVVLYFEVEDLESMEKAILQAGFEFIHRIQEQPWKQKNFRFYDYDGHINEVAETMSAVCRRFVDEGQSVQEIADFTNYTVEKVKELLDN